MVRQAWNDKDGWRYQIMTIERALKAKNCEIAIRLLLVILVFLWLVHQQPPILHSSIGLIELVILDNIKTVLDTTFKGIACAQKSGA